MNRRRQCFILSTIHLHLILHCLLLYTRTNFVFVCYNGRPAQVGYMPFWQPSTFISIHIVCCSVVPIGLWIINLLCLSSCLHSQPVCLQQWHCSLYASVSIKCIIILSVTCSQCNGNDNDWRHQRPLSAVRPVAVFGNNVGESDARCISHISVGDGSRHRFECKVDVLVAWTGPRAFLHQKHRSNQHRCSQSVQGNCCRLCFLYSVSNVNAIITLLCACTRWVWSLFIALKLLIWWEKEHEDHENHLLLVVLFSLGEGRDMTRTS